jgi:hypothetical protein
VLGGTPMPTGLSLELCSPGFVGGCETPLLQPDPSLISNDHVGIITVIVTDLRHEPLEVWFDLIMNGLRNEAKKRTSFGGKLAEAAGEHIRSRVDCTTAKGLIGQDLFRPPFHPFIPVREALSCASGISSSSSRPGIIIGEGRPARCGGGTAALP